MRSALHTLVYRKLAFDVVTFCCGFSAGIFIAAGTGEPISVESPADDVTPAAPSRERIAYTRVTAFTL